MLNRFSHKGAHLICPVFGGYHNVPKFSDKWVWANRAEPDHTDPLVSDSSDQGLDCLTLDCLQYCLHFVDIT